MAIAVTKIHGLDAEGLDRVQREAQATGRLGDLRHPVPRAKPGPTSFHSGSAAGKRPAATCSLMQTHVKPSSCAVKAANALQRIANVRRLRFLNSFHH